MSEFFTWSRTMPSPWKLSPLKAVASYFVSNVDKVPAEDEIPVQLCNYTDVYKNEFIVRSMEFMRSTATTQEMNKFGLKKDDVVITKDSETWDDIAIPALVVEPADDLVCGYHLAIIRPNREQMLGRFLFRCLQSKSIRLQLELASTGVTRFGLPKDEIGKAVVPVPPLAMQERIVGFLDEETSRIDALILEKEQMLALLSEERAALVTQVVTRGMDPTVRLKPSGLAWLGEIPEYWHIQRLKFHLDYLEQGWSPQCDNFPAAEGEWGVLKVGAVNKWDFDPDENKRLPDNIEPLVEYEVGSGDVLMSRANTAELLGSIVQVGHVRPRLILCDKLYRLGVAERLVVRQYLVYYLRSNPARYFFEREATGASNSMQNIGQDTIRNIPVLLPPIREQEAIVSYINSEWRRTSRLETELRRSVALLRERRNAVIAAAVAGQIPPEGGRRDP